MAFRHPDDGVLASLGRLSLFCEAMDMYIVFLIMRLLHPHEEAARVLCSDLEFDLGAKKKNKLLKEIAKQRLDPSTLEKLRVILGDVATAHTTRNKRLHRVWLQSEEDESLRSVDITKNAYDDATPEKLASDCDKAEATFKNLHNLLFEMGYVDSTMR